MCSLYPLISGERGIPENAMTLAQILKDAGYQTAGFNLENPYLSSRCGYGKGFDLYEDFWDKQQSDIIRRKLLWSRFKKDIQDRMGRYNLAFLLFFQVMCFIDRGPFKKGEEATKKALNWLTQNRGNPFFAWIHYMDVHYPYLPEKEKYVLSDAFKAILALGSIIVGAYSYPLRLMRKLYEERIKSVDNMIGSLINELKEKNLYEKTVIIITSDHGDMFHEHGGFTHGPEMYDELLRVPMVIKIPGNKMQKNVYEQVSLIDLAPTILEMSRIGKNEAFIGNSFYPVLNGERHSGSHYVFSEATHRGGRRSRRASLDKYRIISCRGKGWKYIYDEEGDKRELYNLEDDPAEKINLVHQETEKADELHTQIMEHLNFVERESKLYEKCELAISEEEEDELNRRLSTLGYL